MKSPSGGSRASPAPGWKRPAPRRDWPTTGSWSASSSPQSQREQRHERRAAPNTETGPLPRDEEGEATMKRFRTQKGAVLFAAGTMIGALVAGGVAYATIPSNSVIDGCYSRSGGALRVIDSTV